MVEEQLDKANSDKSNLLLSSSEQCIYWWPLHWIKYKKFTSSNSIDRDLKFDAHLNSLINVDKKQQ